MPFQHSFEKLTARDAGYNWEMDREPIEVKPALAPVL